MAQERKGAREGDPRGERERLPKSPTNIVCTCFLGERKLPIGREAPEGKSNRTRR